MYPDRRLARRLARRLDEWHRLWVITHRPIEGGFMIIKTITCRWLPTLLAAIVTLGVTLTTAAGQYPEKSIEFIIPFGAGGGADIEGRLLAKEMSKILNVPVVAVNKPGAGGAVTYTYVKNAKPDGYTVGWNSTSILTTTNIGNVPFGYDAMAHIGRVEFQPMVFAVKATAAWQSFADFAAACKTSPATLKVGNSGTGSATHLAAIAMMSASGCEAIHVPLGIKRRNAGLLSGETDAMAAPLTGALNLAKAKKIRILSHLSGQANPVIPEAPSMKSLGYDIELDLFRGLSVPAATPAPIKAKLAEAMQQAAQSPAFQKLANTKGFTVAPMGPDDFEAYLAAHDQVVQQIMKDAGLYQSKATK